MSEQATLRTPSRDSDLLRRGSSYTPSPSGEMETIEESEVEVHPVRVLTSRKHGVYSPLRYPGGKASLTGLFQELIAKLGLDKPTYIEPYAGGVGAGIALLAQGRIGSLVINDIDPAVYAFWKSVTTRNAEFCRLIREVPLSVEEWLKQREVYRQEDLSDILGLGFAFFYLNRTNRSGILNGGVIGGLAQGGNYKIDARFNKETLIDRVRKIGELSELITVHQHDGREILRLYGDDASNFIYIDPPYVKAGGQLYLNAFDPWDHSALAKMVDGIGQSHWLITYDDHPMIQRLYQQHYQCKLQLMYSANNTGRAEELVVASSRVAEALRDSSL